MGYPAANTGSAGAPGSPGGPPQQTSSGLGGQENSWDSAAMLEQAIQQSMTDDASPATVTGAGASNDTAGFPRAMSAGSQGPDPRQNEGFPTQTSASSTGTGGSVDEEAMRRAVELSMQDG